MKTEELLLKLLEEAYSRKTWHGPNLRQALRGINAKQAAWRPTAANHNIWELVLHAAYWKYIARRRFEGLNRGSFPVKGRNFYPRPEAGKSGEKHWRMDLALLEAEHTALLKAVRECLQSPKAKKLLPTVYGVAYHDVYHAGQIRLLRSLMAKSK